MKKQQFINSPIVIKHFAIKAEDLKDYFAIIDLSVHQKTKLIDIAKFDGEIDKTDAELLLSLVSKDELDFHKEYDSEDDSEFIYFQIPFFTKDTYDFFIEIYGEITEDSPNLLSPYQFNNYWDNWENICEQFKTWGEYFEEINNRITES